MTQPLIRAATELALPDPPEVPDIDPFEENRSEGNRRGWADKTPEERSAWAQEMQRRKDEKKRARATEEEKIFALQKAALTPEQFKDEFVHPKAVLAIGRLWDIAERKDDKDLFRWFAEQKIGKPGSKDEVAHSGGVTITVVRPPRGDVIQGEVVSET